MDSGAVQCEESQDTHVTSQVVQAVKVSLCYFAAQADEDVVIVVVVVVVAVVIVVVIPIVVLGICSVIRPKKRNCLFPVTVRKKIG